ncbi:MAG: YjbQ family protein [Gammaproteobacteria bacterium]|nr:YjbQ family protein [Gammaproteobacteria bacterium]
MHQSKFTVRTSGRGTTDITTQVQDVVREAGVEQGICHVFNHHTSASLMLCENADATVRRDLEAWMQRAVPDGDPLFEHTAEGPDDMPAHVRTLLTHSSLSIPVTAGRCSLGTWQGIYLWEHRHAPHTRSITVTVQA